MASIEERKLKSGRSFYRVRFRLDGEMKRICLDSSYSRSDAEDALAAIERFVSARKLNEPIDRRTRLYFESAPPDLLKRFAAIGFDVAKRGGSVFDVWRMFVKYKENDPSIKESTVIHYVGVFNRFAPFFNERTKFDDLTPQTVQDFRNELCKTYARTTVSNTIADLRAFANWAVERGYATSNPFMSVVRGSTANKTRDFQVPVDWSERILAACPTQNWRTLFALWRFAALRQQEPMSLTRDSIRLSERKLLVYATKTERYANGGLREVPIVPILAKELEAQLREMPKDEEYLIYTNRRKAFDSGFRKILFAAGLKKWPKTFQNLRSSCENDWVAQGIPARVVASWLGHSVKTQETYYLRVLPEYFDRVTQNVPHEI